MKTAGQVSVIVPFLNAERFIREAIESVLAQTYGNWELLLVDDGSSDAGSRIALEYKARDPQRISYLSHRNHRQLGPAAARNLGITRAKGEFLAFLDADDVWLPHKLDEQVRILARSPEVGMVYGATQSWYSWTGKAADRDRDSVEMLGVPTGVVHPPLSLLRPCFVLQEAAIPNPTSVLVRRSVVEKVGGFEESVPDGHEDQAFYAKVCVGASILSSDGCFDRYRQHPGSLTAKKAHRLESDRSHFLSWLIEYLSDHGVDREICAALRRQRFSYTHPRLNRVARAIRVSGS